MMCETLLVAEYISMLQKQRSVGATNGSLMSLV